MTFSELFRLRVLMLYALWILDVLFSSLIISVNPILSLTPLAPFCLKKMSGNDFMASMTFAFDGAGGGCDCDECGIAIPAPILAAIRKQKRQRLETGPLRRTQERRLICRDEGIAVWKTTMPVDAEPLIEYGSSHRLVFVKRLGANHRLRSIGQGIIGSNDEEKSRKDLDEWAQGSVFLVKSNGGKAVGWTHNLKRKNDDSTPQQNQKTGHAILLIVKVPISKVKSKKEYTDAKAESCSEIFLRHSQKALENQNEGDLYYQFSESDSAVLQSAFAEVEATNDRESNVASNGPSAPPVPVERL